VPSSTPAPRNRHRLRRGRSAGHGCLEALCRAEHAPPLHHLIGDRYEVEILDTPTVVLSRHTLPYRKVLVLPGG
jgi:hypothetical protein